jgi:nitroreductase
LDHAKEVFNIIDVDGSGSICASELGEILQSLDMQASQEEASALFKYLDVDQSGEISLDTFLPWYSDAVEMAKEVSTSFQTLLKGRRTVDDFDQTPISDDVLRRAIDCAIAAPNRSGSEPWRFIQVGPDTVEKIASLLSNMESDEGAEYSSDWTKIPGWCVVTTKLSGEKETEMDDFKSTSCAVQNFMLSMWSEGIGSKWTNGPVQKTQEFADLCGVDITKEKVVGCIWYGFARGGLVNADPKRRKKTVNDVLFCLP